MNEPDPVTVGCADCAHSSMFMGTLGALDWFRCRYCGAERSAPHEHREPDPSADY